MNDKILDIASKTIGFDLAQVTAPTKEETKKWLAEQECKKKEFEDEHPEIIEQRKRWNDLYASKKPYIPTQAEKQVIHELLHMDMDSINEMEITIFKDGDISVRTPTSSWMSLAGREWKINIKEKTVKTIVVS